VTFFQKKIQTSEKNKTTNEKQTTFSHLFLLSSIYSYSILFSCSCFRMNMMVVVKYCSWREIPLFLLHVLIVLGTLPISSSSSSSSELRLAPHGEDASQYESILRRRLRSVSLVEELVTIEKRSVPSPAQSPARIGRGIPRRVLDEGDDAIIVLHAADATQSPSQLPGNNNIADQKTYSDMLMDRALQPTLTDANPEEAWSRGMQRKVPTTRITSRYDDHEEDDTAIVAAAAAAANRISTQTEQRRGKHPTSSALLHDTKELPQAAEEHVATWTTAPGHPTSTPSTRTIPPAPRVEEETGTSRRRTLQKIIPRTNRPRTSATMEPTTSASLSSSSSSSTLTDSPTPAPSLKVIVPLTTIAPTSSSTPSIVTSSLPPAAATQEPSSKAGNNNNNNETTHSPSTMEPTLSPSLSSTTNTNTSTPTTTTLVPTAAPTKSNTTRTPAPTTAPKNDNETADGDDNHNNADEPAELCACSFTRPISDSDPCRVYGGHVDPNEFQLTAWHRGSEDCLIALLDDGSSSSSNHTTGNFLQQQQQQQQQRAQLYDLCRPVNSSTSVELLDVEAMIQLARNGGDKDLAGGSDNADYVPLSDRIKLKFLNRGYFVQKQNGTIVLSDTLTVDDGGGGEVVLDCKATPDLCWDQVAIDMRNKAIRFQLLCNKELAVLAATLNEEQKTARTQICSLLRAADAGNNTAGGGGVPKFCNPLSTQIQQVLEENPNVVDCAAFGKGPRQEPVPFCEYNDEIVDDVSTPPSSMPTLVPSSSILPSLMPSDANTSTIDSYMPSEMPSDAPSQSPTTRLLSDVNITTLTPSATPSTQQHVVTLPPTVEPEPGTPVSFRLFGISMILYGVGSMDTAARDIWIETTIQFYENFYNNGTTTAVLPAATADRRRQLRSSTAGGRIRDFSTVITFQSQNATTEGNTLFYTQQVSYETIGSSAPTTSIVELLQEPFRNETLNRQYAEALRASGHVAFTKLPANETAASVPILPQEDSDKNDGDDQDGLSTVEIVGIAIGGAAGLVLLLYLACQYCYCCCCGGGKKRNGRRSDKLESSPLEKGGGYDDHRDDYHDKPHKKDKNDSEQPRGGAGSPSPHSEVLGKIKSDRRSRRNKRSQLAADDVDDGYEKDLLCGLALS
jgi:hypothetical protein